MKAASRRAPLAIHSAGECGCSPTANPNECPYQVFPDGWDFTPDVGNGQRRGEVFTPRFVVDKMIATSGILPAEAVYERVYETDTASLEHAFDKRIIEPAVGTGNFLATIAHHRTRYALEAAASADHLTSLLIRLTTTLYAFDIDPGNVEVTVRRLLDGDTSRMDHPSVISSWVDTLADALPSPDAEALLASVKQSLTEAQAGWGMRMNGQGVLSRAWYEYTGDVLPDDLYDHLAEILEANIKVFDGLSRESTGVLPGKLGVEWTWWNQDGSIMKMVPHSG